MATYAQLAASGLVTATVVDDLSLDDSPTAVAERVTVTNPADTTVIVITARDPDPRQAQLLAAAVAGRFVEAIGSIETVERFRFSVVQPARFPTEAVAPQPFLSIGLGALVGATAGWLVLRWPTSRSGREALDA